MTNSTARELMRGLKDRRLLLPRGEAAGSWGRPLRRAASRLAPWLLALLALGCAGRDPYRKLPEDEQVFLRAVDVFLEPEEIDAYVEAPDLLTRRELAERLAVAKKWELLSVEEREAIDRGEVLVGMSKDAVFMALGAPLRIRPFYDSEIGDRVESYQYRYERTSRGEVFLSPPNSRTAYKNEVFERHVEFVGGRVRAVLEVEIR